MTAPSAIQATAIQGCRFLSGLSVIVTPLLIRSTRRVVGPTAAVVGVQELPEQGSRGHDRVRAREAVLSHPVGQRRRAGRGGERPRFAPINRRGDRVLDDGPPEHAGPRLKTVQRAVDRITRRVLRVLHHQEHRLVLVGEAIGYVHVIVRLRDRIGRAATTAATDGLALHHPRQSAGRAAVFAAEVFIGHKRRVDAAGRRGTRSVIGVTVCGKAFDRGAAVRVRLAQDGRWTRQAGGSQDPLDGVVLEDGRHVVAGVVAVRRDRRRGRR